MTEERLNVIREWAEVETGSMHPINDLLTYVDQLRAELETERMRLAACGVVAMANTEASKPDRIGKENPYWSASYGDVCAAVDREIAMRAELADVKKCKVEAETGFYKYRDLYAACQKERDALQAKLAEYAPVRVFYGPAGLLSVSAIIKERDRYRDALQQIASWCQTPSNPDDCRIAECYVARKALKERE